MAGARVFDLATTKNETLIIVMSWTKFHITHTDIDFFAGELQKDPGPLI